MTRRCETMRNKGWTLGIIVASLAFVFVALALVAAPADATITGSQPPATGDWIIDQDTTVLGESLKIVGEINVEPGNTLKVRNSEIKINSTSPGEHGIYVDSNSTAGDGMVEFDDCTIRADTEDNGWFFEIYGGLKIIKARLYNVEDGMQIYSSNVDVANMTLYAQGEYGIYIERSNPKIHNSDIYAKGYEGITVRGIRVYGDSGTRAAPDFDGLMVHVYRNDKVTSDSGYTYVYVDMIGVDIYYGQFTKLSGIDVSFEYTGDVDVNYSYNPYVRVYYYVTGYVFSGGTILGGMDVTLSNSTYFVDADAEGAQSGYLYMYNYFVGLGNYIGSDGESPDVFTGFTMMNQRMTWDTNQIYNERPYYYGTGFRWFPSSSATVSDTYTVQGIHIENVEVEDMVAIDMGKKHLFLNNVFKDSYLDDFLIEYRYMYNQVDWRGNQIINNSMTRAEFFNLYRCDAEITFQDNNISQNTYYRMFYLYYPYDVITFDGNTFLDNKAHTSTYAFFYIYRNYAKVDLEENYFGGNNWRYFAYMYYSYSSVDMTMNTWHNNSGTSWGIYNRYMQSAAPLDFSDNVMTNNSFNGWLYSYYQYSLWTIEDNVLDGNSLGSKGFLWLYSNPRAGGFDITDNQFINNTGSGPYFKFFALGWASYTGSRPLQTFIFERNIFINNTGSTASNSGLVYFYKNRQDFAVRDCEFYNNSANCIVMYFDHKYYNYVFINNIAFEDNLFYNNTGYGIAVSEINDDYITIRGNEGAGNEAYVVWIDHSKGYQYLYSDSDHEYVYSYGYPNGPRMLVIEANNFSYNRGGGIWAKVSQYSSQYSYYNPGQPNADIRIKKNMLYGNGPDGYTLAMDNLYRKPSVKSNRIDGSSMGMFWGLIRDDSRYTPFDMEFREVVMDGGPEGKTAYGFSNIDAAFYDCMFTNFSVCFYAEDCEVNVYWSGVPEASGETSGKGRIYIWNHLEIWVTWGNASGVDSGIPTPGAVVAMQGANGRYFGAIRTNDEGKLLDPEGDPMIITPWTCVEGIMDAWSPFTITLLAQENVSTAHEVQVTEDFMDPNPLRLTLNDIFIPEVIIANPQDDTLVDEADVLTEGFLFEIGSGIVTFEGRTDMMPEDEWVTITRNVLWQHVFEGMTEGYHNMSVRAADLSGNWNTSNIEIIVDLTDPGLMVELEYLNATKIPYDEELGGYFVRDKEIAINGSYDDNYAHVGDIIIRINGIAKYIFPSQWGNIYERMDLDQGINTIIVDATDTAGNRAAITLYVSLDSYPPTMYIYEPLDGQMTANETLIITGLTEPLTRLDIIVQASAGTNTYRSQSLTDGTFSYPVTLFEGIRKVLVTAIDSAGNPTVLDLNVILDTTPPDFIINQPPEAYVVTKLTRYTIVGTMTYEPDADVIIGGQQVVNTGVFQREVVLQEGENVIDIVAIDKVGNQNTKYVTIVRDTVPPVLEVTMPEEDFVITNDQTVSFGGLVEGSTGVVIVHKSIRLPAELVSGTWEMGEWKYDLELGPQDLEQDVEVIAFDLAENEDIMSIHIKLDIVPPSLTMDPTDEVVYTPFVWINGTTDEGVPFVYVEGVTYPVTDGVFEIQWSLAAGENNLDIEVMDEAGNVASDLVTVTYERPDYTPPPPPDDEGLDFMSILGIGILLAAIIILVTALFVVYSRRRR
jgi:hypothetical protein